MINWTPGRHSTPRHWGLLQNPVPFLQEQGLARHPCLTCAPTFLKSKPFFSLPFLFGVQLDLCQSCVPLFIFSYFPIKTSLLINSQMPVLISIITEARTHTHQGQGDSLEKRSKETFCRYYICNIVFSWEQFHLPIGSWWPNHS